MLVIIELDWGDVGKAGSLGLDLRVDKQHRAKEKATTRAKTVATGIRRGEASRIRRMERKVSEKKERKI